MTSTPTTSSRRLSKSETNVLRLGAIIMLAFSIESKSSNPSRMLRMEAEALSRKRRLSSVFKLS